MPTGRTRDTDRKPVHHRHGVIAPERVVTFTVTHRPNGLSGPSPSAGRTPSVRAQEGS